MESLAKQARDAYAEGQYSLAEKLYTKAINITMREPNILLHDGRAASLEKLSRLQEALNDGKRMYTEALEAYLRTGKILQLLDRDAAAAKCYERGLQKVPKNDRLYATLTHVSNTVELRILRENPRRDPFMILPLETIWHIVESLSFMQRVRCTRVSKGWHEILSQPMFYFSIDLTTDVTKLPKLASVTSYIRKAKGGLRELKATVSFGQSLRHTVTLCKDLACLAILYDAHVASSIHMARNLSEIHFYNDERHTTLTIGVMQYIISILPKLQYFSAAVTRETNHRESLPSRYSGAKCLSLRVLRLRTTGVQVFQPNFENLPRLEELRLHNFGAVDLGSNKALQQSRLQVLEIEGGMTIPFVQLPATLETLALGMWSNHSTPWHAPFPSLKSFSVSHIGDWDIQNLRDIFEASSSSLVSLVLDFCSLDEDAFISLSLKLPFLKDLVITNSNTITDTILVKIGGTLERLEVSHCPNLTGASILDLTNRTPRYLTSLSCRNCDRIGTEVMKWVRDKFIGSWDRT